jgi:hypothetical protein
MWKDFKKENGSSGQRIYIGTSEFEYHREFVDRTVNDLVTLKNEKNVLELKIEKLEKRIDEMINHNIKSDFSNNDGNNKRHEIDALFNNIVGQLIPRFKRLYPTNMRSDVGDTINTIFFYELYYYLDKFRETNRLLIIEKSNLVKLKTFMLKQLLDSLSKFDNVKIDNKDLESLIENFVNLIYLMVHEKQPLEFILPTNKSTYDTDLHEDDLDITITKMIYPGLKAKDQKFVFKKAKVKLQIE